MTAPHVIRLRGPWQLEAVRQAPGLAVKNSPSAEDTLVQSVDLPAKRSALLPPDFQGRVNFKRRFGCPTGLGASDRVDLVVEHLAEQATVRLNEESLVATAGGLPPARFSIRSSLEPRNQLSIEIVIPLIDARQSESSQDAMVVPHDTLVGDVHLEIRPAES